MSLNSTENGGKEFDEQSLCSSPVDEDEIHKFCDHIVKSTKSQSIDTKLLNQFITLIDLTTLSGDDTTDRVQKLCGKAVAPLPYKDVHCAAVCVYPARVADVASKMTSLGAIDKLGLASVAGGFPSGQYRLETRLSEISYAVEDGATEIDTVINRCAALEGNWKKVYDELREMRKACGKAHLKTILATGELKSYDTIYKASQVAMWAGSHFIKTSTGKEPVNATLQVSYVMCLAIKKYFEDTGVKVGFKPAGGISKPEVALQYYELVKRVLGEEWLNPTLFRFGASSLLDNILIAL